MNAELEKVKAMLAEALAEARSSGAQRITALHLTIYDRSQEVFQVVREAVEMVSAGTPAEGARLITRPAPSRYICWNCCGLRFESTEKDAVCPNCGGLGFIIPSEITFALDHVEFDDCEGTQC